MADAPDTILVNGALVGGGLVSFQTASVPHNGSGWRLEAYGTKGTLVATSAALPQIIPIQISGARGGDPLAPLEVPVREPAGVTVPAGPGHNIARSYARMARAIRDGAAAKPDFRHAVGVHRLLDALRRSAEDRRTIGVDSRSRN